MLNNFWYYKVTSYLKKDILCQSCYYVTSIFSYICNTFISMLIFFWFFDITLTYSWSNFWTFTRRRRKITKIASFLCRKTSLQTLFEFLDRDNLEKGKKKRNKKKKRKKKNTNSKQPCYFYYLFTWAQLLKFRQFSGKSIPPGRNRRIKDENWIRCRSKSRINGPKWSWNCLFWCIASIELQ